MTLSKEKMAAYQKDRRDKLKGLKSGNKILDTDSNCVPMVPSVPLEVLNRIEKRLTSLEARVLLLESIPESQGVGPLVRKAHKESKEDASSLFDRVVAEKARRMRA